MRNNIRVGLRKWILFAGCNLLVASALAIPTNITSPSAAPKSDLGNFGDATVLAWLGGEVSAYNTAHNSALSAPVNVNQIGLQTGAGGDSITLTLGNYNYVFFHWGGQGGGWAQAYYIGNDSGSFTFNAPPGGHPAVGGLSFYSFYGTPTTPATVPDGGKTALLLGAVLAGLVLTGRKQKSATLIRI